MKKYYKILDDKKIIIIVETNNKTDEGKIIYKHPNLAFYENSQYIRYNIFLNVEMSISEMIAFKLTYG